MRHSPRVRQCAAALVAALGASSSRAVQLRGRYVALPFGESAKPGGGAAIRPDSPPTLFSPAHVMLHAPSSNTTWRGRGWWDDGDGVLGMPLTLTQQHQQHRLCDIGYDDSRQPA